MDQGENQRSENVGEKKRDMHLRNDKTLIDETGEGEGLDDHSFDEIFE